MYCSGCGLKLETGIAKYCSGCGRVLPVNNRPAAKPGSALRDIADTLRKSGALCDAGLLGTNQPFVPLTKSPEACRDHRGNDYDTVSRRHVLC